MRADSNPSPISPRTSTDVPQCAASRRATNGPDMALDSSLEAALVAAVVRADSAVDSEPDIAISDPELERYRSAIRAFVARCKAVQLPPERVIVELKTSLHASLREQGKEREELRLRQVLIATFIDAYYVVDGSG